MCAIHAHRSEVKRYEGAGRGGAGREFRAVGQGLVKVEKMKKEEAEEE